MFAAKSLFSYGEELIIADSEGAGRKNADHEGANQTVSDVVESPAATPAVKGITPAGGA
ncbi:MAG: hypothetical protein Q8Q12_04475 [bacterium]|nr:hypothetical protein [bacterium]